MCVTYDFLREQGYIFKRLSFKETGEGEGHFIEKEYFYPNFLHSNLFLSSKIDLTSAILLTSIP